MVNHAVEAEELQAYLDRELTPPRQVEVQQHLADCRACAALLEELQQVSATLHQWQIEPAPVSLHPPEIATARSPRWWWRWQGGLGLAAAAAVVLVVAAVSIPNLYRAKLASHTTEVAVPPAPAQPGATEEPQGRVAATAPEPAKKVLSARAPDATQLPQRQEADAEKGIASGGTRERKQEEAEGVVTGRTAEVHQDRLAVGEATDNSMAGKRAAAEETSKAEERPAAIAPERYELRSPDAGRTRDQAAAAGTTSAMSKQKMEVEAPERLIAFEARLALEVKDFDAAKAKLERVVQENGGYVAEASSGETPGQARFADYALRVPAEKLSAVMDSLRTLGRVKSENLSTEEVTEQVVDLDARLRNARATEERLVALLKERTGKVRDVLEVEREISGTREDIERMDARRQYLMRRVTLSTLTVTLVEEFKAQLQPAPAGTATRLRNAFVEGYENFAATLLGLIFFFARHGLTLFFWTGLFWTTGRLCLRLLSRRWQALS